jgi:hypothetical protein
MVGNAGAEHRAVRVERVEFFRRGRHHLAETIACPATGPGPFPAVSMTHGFGGTIFHGLLPYAELFAQAGLNDAGRRSSRFQV